jgi:hypothetical protein
LHEGRHALLDARTPSLAVAEARRAGDRLLVAGEADLVVDRLAVRRAGLRGRFGGCGLRGRRRAFARAELKPRDRLDALGDRFGRHDLRIRTGHRQHELHQQDDPDNRDQEGEEDDDDQLLGSLDERFVLVRVHEFFWGRDFVRG